MSTRGRRGRGGRGKRSSSSSSSTAPPSNAQTTAAAAAAMKKDPRVHDDTRGRRIRLLASLPSLRDWPIDVVIMVSEYCDASIQWLAWDAHNHVCWAINLTSLHQHLFHPSSSSSSPCSSAPSGAPPSLCDIRDMAGAWRAWGATLDHTPSVGAVIHDKLYVAGSGSGIIMPLSLRNGTTNAADDRPAFKVPSLCVTCVLPLPALARSDDDYGMFRRALITTHGRDMTTMNDVMLARYMATIRCHHDDLYWLCMNNSTGEHNVAWNPRTDQYFQWPKPPGIYHSLCAWQGMSYYMMDGHQSHAFLLYKCRCVAIPHMASML